MPRKKAETEAAPIIAYKGFDKNLQCRGYQYEIGKTFKHDGPVRQCESGFHVCQNPLDVLDFYDMSEGNRFARVVIGGKIDRSEDKKWAAAELTIQAELKLPDFIRAGVEWIAAACKIDDSVEVTTGHSAKNASSGHSAKNASSGHYATNASSGDYAKNASSGDYGYSSAEGEHAVITAAGRETRAKGAKGVWISLAEYKRVGSAYHCIGFATGQAGYDGVPVDTWLIAKGGKLVAG